MIGYLRGKALKVSEDCCLLDVGGVGYRIFVGGVTRSRMVQGEETALFIHTAVREDAILLYGFHSEEEYETFQLLISVSGVGPKVALGILSSITANQLSLAISQKKTAVLTKLPGIGKKTAERIILELKDKVSPPDSLSEEDIGTDTPEIPPGDELSEAKAALMALGYSQGEVQPVLRKIGGGRAVQEIIKAALKELNKSL